MLNLNFELRFRIVILEKSRRSDLFFRSEFFLVGATLSVNGLTPFVEDRRYAANN
jgi:hypothetical protein